jgi:hypothetical protein
LCEWRGKNCAHAMSGQGRMCRGAACWGGETPKRKCGMKPRRLERNFRNWADWLGVRRPPAALVHLLRFGLVRVGAAKRWVRRNHGAAPVPPRVSTAQSSVHRIHTSPTCETGPVLLPSFRLCFRPFTRSISTRSTNVRRYGALLLHFVFLRQNPLNSRHACETPRASRITHHHPTDFFDTHTHTHSTC